MSFLRRAYKRCCDFLSLVRLARYLHAVKDEKLWAAAKQAVSEVVQMPELQKAAQKEARTAFCPMCGQIPDGDRRFDHARQRTLALVAPMTPSRSEVDAAIALEYWMRKIDAR